MASRLELHELLIKTLGSKNVYFQPPATISMRYPCIVYGLDDVNTRYADNNPYTHRRKYQLTVIDRDPDNDVYMKLLTLPESSFNTHFASENLNHYVLSLFF